MEPDKAEAIVTSGRARAGRRATRRSGGSRGHGQPERASITLTGEAFATALALAEQHHISPGEVARRGIAVLKFLTDEEKKGSVLRIQSPDGETDRIRIVFT
jgi:hypothetical protein